MEERNMKQLAYFIIALCSLCYTTLVNGAG